MSAAPATEPVAPLRVVATAGHVDHGKSTLLRVLTGMEPDRYEEERRRGLTLDLGFVWTTLPSGRGVAFVDVPGHHRLVRTMLAGVGAVDLCVFVVAATEGWMPQSEEHLRILELVGARDGIVVLTKADLAEPELLDVARLQVVEALAGTFLDGAPLIEVDALSGRGIDDVRGAIDALIERAPQSPDGGRPRLWIDRSFSIRGAGAVVTGTLGGGGLAVDDEMVVLAEGRPPRAVRIRGLEGQGARRDSVPPATRVAVNLVGVHHTEVGRGSVLVRDGQWRPSARLDVEVTVLPAAPAAIGNRGALLAYIGTSEQPVRVRLLEGQTSVEPGGTGRARLWLRFPVPVLPGDRLVLRDTGRDETVAGGEVLDVAPVLPVSRARPERSIQRVVDERGWVGTDELEALTGERRAAVVGRWVVSDAALAEARRQIEAAVDAAGPLGADLAVMDERVRAVVPMVEGLVASRGRLTRAGAVDPLASHPWVAGLEAAPFNPPPPDGVAKAEVRELVRRGLVVEAEGELLAAAAVDEARRRVAVFLADHPEGIGIGEVRDLLGTSRKWALAFAAALDVRGITRRRGDVRIAGPRLDRPLS